MPYSQQEKYINIFCYHHTYTHTHPFNGTLSRTTRVNLYQKGKTNLDFTEARDSEWQWHQLGHMQVRTPLQTDNHTSTQPLSFTGRMPFLLPTNSVKALKTLFCYHHTHTFNGPLSGTTWVSQYQKSKSNLDFTEARDSE